MANSNLDKLAQELVVERLKGVSHAPAGAGEIAREIINKAITDTQTRQTPHDSVNATCRGIMAGMILLEQDLPRTAVAILSQMSLVASASNQDPSELMTWAMEGIAPIAKLAGRDACKAIEDAIESAFMGAGSVFSKVCETAGA